MLEVLTGTGLATAAGLNAALPLIVLGALDRWTTLVTLPPDWAWLADGWVLAILGLLLLLEVVADKVPGLDHVNDVVQTVIRPTSGGLAFAAGSGSQTVAVTDPSAFVSSGQWVPVAIGLLLALGVHTGKALARPVITATTLGVGTPVVSTAEDGASLALSLAAVLVPVLVVVLIVVVVVLTVRAVRRARRRRPRVAAG